MFTKIKEFFLGKPSESEAPYKVETPAPKAEAAPAPEIKVESVPLGTEATIAAPVAAKPKAAPKPKAPAKPKAEPKPKAAGKPKAPVNSAAK